MKSIQAKSYALLLIVALGVIAGVTVVIGSVPIFQDGFENGLSPWTGQSGTVSVQSSIVHHGAQALYASGSSDSYVYKSLSSLSSVNVRVWVRAATLPSLNYYGHDVIQIYSGTTLLASVQIYKESSSVGWRILYWDGKVKYPGRVGSVSSNTWYCLEANVQVGSPGSVTLWVGGSQLAKYSASNNGLSITSVRVGAMVGYPSYNKATYSDCVVVGTAYIGTSCDAQPQGTLSVDSTPVKGQCFVNGTSWGTTPQTRTVSIGKYTVSWGAVQGYVTPQPQTVTVSLDATTSVVGIYEPVPPSPPSWSNLGHNSTNVGSPCKMYAKWSDPDGLKGYIFSWNGTGSWTNSTWTKWSGSPTQAWSNVTMVLPNVNGVRVGYRFYANETYGSWNKTTIDSFVTTKPQTWENTVLTLNFDPQPSSDLPPYRYRVYGSLTFQSNSTGISSARLRFYIGLNPDYAFLTTVVTRADGSYEFYWIKVVTGEYSVKGVYQSDRDWALGTSVEKTALW